MSASETEDYGTPTDDGWSTAKRLGKVLALSAVGIGLFALAGYIYVDPVMDRSWVAGVGFYELFCAAAGTLVFYAAYSNLRGLRGTGSGGY